MFRVQVGSEAVDPILGGDNAISVRKIRPGADCFAALDVLPVAPLRERVLMGPAAIGSRAIRAPFGPLRPPPPRRLEFTDRARHARPARRTAPQHLPESPQPSGHEWRPRLIRVSTRSALLRPTTYSDVSKMQ